MQYTWHKKYATGLKVIDEQHKHFISLFNQFEENFNRYSKEKGNEDLEKKLTFLCDYLLNYALYHFSEEEVYLFQCLCDKCKAHIRSHNAYRKTIQKYNEELSNPKIKKLQTFKKIRDYAEKYFIKHIMNGHEKGFLSCLIRISKTKKAKKN